MGLPCDKPCLTRHRGSNVAQPVWLFKRYPLVTQLLERPKSLIALDLSLVVGIEIWGSPCQSREGGAYACFRRVDFVKQRGSLPTSVMRL